MHVPQEMDARSLTSRKNKIIWLEKGWQPVYVGFCPSRKAWNKLLKKLKQSEPYPTSNARCTFFRHADGKSSVVVTIDSKTAKRYNGVEIMALLAHEAVHVFQFICESIGESDPSPEFEAYSIQSILLQLCSAYEKSTGDKLGRP